MTLLKLHPSGNLKLHTSLGARLLLHTTAPAVADVKEPIRGVLVSDGSTSTVLRSDGTTRTVLLS